MSRLDDYFQSGVEHASEDRWDAPIFDQEAKDAYVRGHGFGSGYRAYLSGGYREPEHPRFLETDQDTMWREAYNAGYEAAERGG